MIIGGPDAESEPVKASIKGLPLVFTYIPEAIELVSTPGLQEVGPYEGHLLILDVLFLLVGVMVRHHFSNRDQVLH
jgi:hypothetical protein